MNFEKQLEETLNELTPIIDYAQPKECLTTISSMGKHLVLEDWRGNNLDNQLLYVQNTYTDSVLFLINYKYQKKLSRASIDNINDALTKYTNDFTNSLEQLLLAKNSDYGSSFAKVSDALGIIPTFSVRILDKCNRLDQLAWDLDHKQDQQVKDESVVDTMQDLLGYYILCIITLKYYK